MKLIQFDCFNLQLRIYKEDEVEAFKKRFKVVELDIGGVHGMSCENGIWIGVADVKTCAHESQHFVDYLLSNWLNIECCDFGETAELRANLVGYVTQKVWDYVS